MNLPKFTYVTPSTLKEALTLLSDKGAYSTILAGGTDVMVAMKQRTSVPDTLINIKGLTGLASIQPDPDGALRIGPLTTLASLAASEVVRQRHPILAEAADKVGSSQIRNVATIGGNICLNTRCWYYNQSAEWRRSVAKCFKMGGDSCLVMKGSDRCNAIFVADTVPSLLALDARLKIEEQGGQRVIPIEEFYDGSGHPPNRLRPEELLTEIYIPKMRPRSFAVFSKFAPREIVDFALVNVALSVSFEGDACTDARIALGGVTSHPIRSLSGEALLKGERLTAKLIEEVGKATAKDAEPITPMWMSPAGKREIIKVLVRKGLERALAYNQQV
jgi:4-hydroxybenzoyl-CoA reductase subunit beta